MHIICMQLYVYVHEDYNFGGFCIPRVWVFFSEFQRLKMLLYHSLQFYNFAITLICNFDID